VPPEVPPGFLEISTGYRLVTDKRIVPAQGYQAAQPLLFQGFDILLTVKALVRDKHRLFDI
jgi:hypothetical protein